MQAHLMIAQSRRYHALELLQASRNNSTVPPFSPHHPPEKPPGAAAHLSRTEQAGSALGAGGSNDGTEERILYRPLLSLPGCHPRAPPVWQRWMSLSQQCLSQTYGVGIRVVSGSVRQCGMGAGGGTGWYSSC